MNMLGDSFMFQLYLRVYTQLLSGFLQTFDVILLETRFYQVWKNKSRKKASNMQHTLYKVDNATREHLK